MLVAVDVADRGAEVVAAAVPWAERWGATVDVGYVSKWGTGKGPPPTVSGELAAALQRDWSARAGSDASALEGLLEKIPAARRGASRLAFGRCTTVLPEIAEGYDVVVVGTHGRTGLTRLLLGSVTARLLRASPCPLLVVGLGDDVAARHTPPRVLVPVDEHDDGVLSALPSWFPAASIEILHVVPPGAWSPMSRAGTDYLPTDEADREQRLTEAIEARVAGAGVKADRVSLVMGAGDNAGDTIAEWAGVRTADLVVLPTQGRTGLRGLVLGSVALRVTERAPCPVLVFPRHLLPGLDDDSE